MARIKTKIAIMIGIQSVSREIVTELIFSMVENTGFPIPPVNFDEAKRNNPVPDWIVPATPPPAKIPNDHWKTGESICKNEVVNIVPATNEDGTAKVSNKLSINGM